jgi:hypothetical protein
MNGSTDISAFRSQVPVVTYDCVQSYIRRIAMGEQSSILCGERIVELLRRSDSISDAFISFFPQFHQFFLFTLFRVFQNFIVPPPLPSFGFLLPSPFPPLFCLCFWAPVGFLSSLPQHEILAKPLFTALELFGVSQD